MWELEIEIHFKKAYNQKRTTFSTKEPQRNRMKEINRRQDKRSPAIRHDHSFFMQEALKEALRSYKEGGIPIGSVLVMNDQIIGRGHNRRVQKGSSILHAEMDCLENAGRLTAKEYAKCTIYSTLSPCEMCSGAILLYKIPHIVIGENETFKGPETRTRRKGFRITNLKSDECTELMRKFIREKPSLWDEDIGE